MTLSPCAPWGGSLDTQVLLRIGRDCVRMMQQQESKMSGKLGDSPVSNAFSTAAAILTLIIFYGIVLVILRYGFGIELWNLFQGWGAAPPQEGAPFGHVH
jgi:hypothetical protein